MIVATETYVVARCPMCGKLETHPLSIFRFAASQTVEINCSCGTTKLIMGTRNRKQFWVQVPCVPCENKHLHYYRGKELWADKVINLKCSNSNQILCHIGPKQEIMALAESMKEDLEAIMVELGYDDYFHSPEVMMEVLNCLHDVAEEGFLYCECGNCQIEVDILPDRLELSCNFCGSVSTLYAETEQDLELVRHMDVIELVGQGFNQIDTMNTRSKNSPRRKKP